VGGTQDRPQAEEVADARRAATEWATPRDEELPAQEERAVDRASLVIHDEVVGAAAGAVGRRAGQEPEVWGDVIASAVQEHNLADERLGECDIGAGKVQPLLRILACHPVGLVAVEGQPRQGEERVKMGASIANDEHRRVTLEQFKEGLPSV
jgi:hypothetical protein